MVKKYIAAFLFKSPDRRESYQEEAPNVLTTGGQKDAFNDIIHMWEFNPHHYLVTPRPRPESFEQLLSTFTLKNDLT